MKILFISLMVLFFLSCGGKNPESSSDDPNLEPPLLFETSDSETEEIVENVTPNEEPDTDNNNKTSGQDSEQLVEASGESATIDICEKYQANCGANLEKCGEKYMNCLLPKAGDPILTKEFVCTGQADTDPLNLRVREWHNSPGKNQLLCDFYENEDLYLFATNTKPSCQEDMMKRVKELHSAGWTCGPKANVQAKEEDKASKEDTPSNVQAKEEDKASKEDTPSDVQAKEDQTPSTGGTSPN